MIVSVMENTTGLIRTFSAKDPNGDTITWTISGGDHALFVITDKTDTTAELSTAANTTLDHDTKIKHHSTLKVDDSNGRVASVILSHCRGVDLECGAGCTWGNGGI